jgi:hypothetical protein
LRQRFDLALVLARLQLGDPLAHVIDLGVHPLDLSAKS